MIIFIPIKQNSQRVPRKNFRTFGEEPLYKHTLLKYKDSKVFIDTDSEEIYLGITNDKRLKHVTVFYRDEKLIGDKTSVCDLLKSFILRYDVKDPIAQIHVTSPFLLKDTVSTAYTYLKRHDSIISCNVHQARFWRKEEYGLCPVNHNPLRLEQTQDLPVLYEENSCFYIFKPETFLRTGNRIGINPYFYQVNNPENIDIDIESDWGEALRLIK